MARLTPALPKKIIQTDGHPCKAMYVVILTYQLHLDPLWNRVWSPSSFHPLEAATVCKVMVYYEVV